MREYLLVMLVAAAVTYLLTGVVRAIARRRGIEAEVRDRDVHAVPIPYLGGVAMLGGVGAAFLLAGELPFLSSQPLVAQDSQAVLLGGLVICAVGVLDDIFDLDAVTKLAGQVIAAGVVVLQGVQFYWLPLPGGGNFSLDAAQAALLTTLAIVVTANAVNFVDGLDGLAAGVVGLGAAGFFTYSFLLAVGQDLTRATTATLVTAALAGVCLGFLPHNFFPARIFMGDSGSMLIGLLLACSTVSLTGGFPQGAVEGSAALLPAMLPLVLPFAVLAVPFLDLLLAVARRWRAGRSPFSPDKQHLHHRLLEIGHSHRGAVLVMYLWAALVIFGLVLSGLSGRWEILTTAVALAVVAVMVTVDLPQRSGGRRGADRPV